MQERRQDAVCDRTLKVRSPLWSGQLGSSLMGTHALACRQHQRQSSRASMMKLLAAKSPLDCPSQKKTTTRSADVAPIKVSGAAALLCKKLTQQVELPRLAPYLLESSLNSQTYPSHKVCD